jgi:hypothetical protein
MSIDNEAHVTAAQRLENMTCDHAQMNSCCVGCGHFSCPCGLYWDDGAWGQFDEEQGAAAFDGYPGEVAR